MAQKKSAFDTPWFNSQDNSFFNQLNKTKIPHLVICGETDDFDEEAIQQFKDEGFDTAYVGLENAGNDFINRIHRTGDMFGAGEYYGIVGKVPLPTISHLARDSDMYHSIRRCCQLRTGSAYETKQPTPLRHRRLLSISHPPANEYQVSTLR